MHPRRQKGFLGEDWLSLGILVSCAQCDYTGGKILPIRATWHMFSVTSFFSYAYLGLGYKVGGEIEV